MTATQARWTRNGNTDAAVEPEGKNMMFHKPYNADATEYIQTGAQSDSESDSDDDEATYAPSQYLQDEDANPADIFENESLSEENTSQLYEAINQLDDRSRDILQDRWLADEKLTLHDLAEKYEISAERVRQIEKNAMKKVKQSIASGL